MKLQKSQQAVLDQLISLMESTGLVPWELPWLNPRSAKAPKNGISRQPYKGINSWVLALQAVKSGYASHIWVTAKQAADRKTMPIEGAAPSEIVFCTKLAKPVELTDGTSKIKTFWLWKSYKVYNKAQLVNPDVFPDQQVNTILADSSIVADITADCIGIIDALNFDHCPMIYNDVIGQAYYRPSTDSVHLPEFDQYKSKEAYFGTLFHELVHSTGHKSRLNRFKADAPLAAFGSEEYSKEELVAEIGAAYLTNHFALGSFKSAEQSAAYIKGWSKHLKDKPADLYSAASKAAEAFNYILLEPDTVASKGKQLKATGHD